MKKGQGTRAGGYFRQIAMPLNSPLPVLRPARRWPVHPGEERVRSEISPAEIIQSSSGMKQNSSRLELTGGALGESRERARDDIFQAETPRPSAMSETAKPLSTARSDSQRQNQRHIYKDKAENPVRPAKASAVISPGEATSLSVSRTSSIAPETHSTKGQEIAEKSLGSISSQAVDVSVRKSRNETASVLESSSKPIYESNVADEAGKQHLEFPLGDETRPAFSHRIGERQDKIEIGSIEVRIVNPTPSLSAVAPPAAPRLRPMAGGAASSSGSLTRGLRGPWGLRQG